jgi:hypothetical protein
MITDADAGQVLGMSSGVSQPWPVQRPFSAAGVRVAPPPHTHTCSPPRCNPLPACPAVPVALKKAPMKPKLAQALSPWGPRHARQSLNLPTCSRLKMFPQSGWLPWFKMARFQMRACAREQAW